MDKLWSQAAQVLLIALPLPKGRGNPHGNLMSLIQTTLLLNLQTYIEDRRGKKKDKHEFLHKKIFTRKPHEDSFSSGVLATLTNAAPSQLS